MATHVDTVVKNPNNVVQWVYDTWQSNINFKSTEGSHKFHEFLNSMNIETLPLSGVPRIQRFHIIKFGYPLRRAGYITAVFTAQVFTTKQSTDSDNEMYYAYAYWPRSNAHIIGPPEYICLSPTYNSRDGEYRNRFTWFKQFNEGYENLTSLLSPIETALLNSIANNELAINVFFYPEDKNIVNEFSSGPNKYTEQSRLGLKALAAILAVDAIWYKNYTTTSHSSQKYASVVTLLYEKYAELFVSYTLKTLYLLSVFITGKENQPYRSQCGQKLIPLTIYEALQINDINYAPWREVWISQLVTDLVINSIAPMFSIYNNWTYLNGINKHLFRYNKSAQAEAVNKSLRRERAIIDNTDHIMGQFNSHIYNSMLYADKFIILTDIAMCSTSEYVGLTIPTTAEIIKKAQIVNPADLRMYENPSMQARYLFDLCYGAHMLHTRVGVVHADLHLHNITIFQYAHQYRDGVIRFKNPVIDIFPHDGWFASLIDFSRAIIGPAARPHIIAESGISYATRFYQNQVSRSIQVLQYYIPNFVVKNIEKIKGLFLAEPDIMFKILTAIDFIAIGRNYSVLLTNLNEGPQLPNEIRTINVAPEGIKIAARIEQIALDQLIINLTKLIDNKKSSHNIVHVGELILPSVFKEYKYISWLNNTITKLRPFTLRDSTLVDIYNGHNLIKYSSTNYERYPPWAKFDELQAHLSKDINIMSITADRSERPFLSSLDMDSYLVTLQEQVNQSIKDIPPSDYNLI